MKIIETIWYFAVDAIDGVFEWLKEMLSRIGSLIAGPLTRTKSDLPACDPFSISDYLSRRERTILDLMEQREKEEPYVITLWLGLDGLQLNEDGSTEWIRRTANNDLADKTGLVLSQESLLDKVERNIKQIETDLMSGKYSNEPQAVRILAEFYKLRYRLCDMEPTGGRYWNI